MKGKIIDNGKMMLKPTNIWMLILVFLVRTITVEYESSGIISQIKYIVAMLAVAIAYLTYKKKLIKKNVFKDELTNILLVIICFAIISILKSIFICKFTIRTLLELFFLMLPIVYAYLLLNILEVEEITYCMKFILVICITGYFFSLDISFKEFINGLFTMDFSNSESILESNEFAGCSISLAFYFLYHNKNKVFEYISIFFVILTFKRLAIIYVIFTWLITRLNRIKTITIKCRMVSISKILFIGGVLLYYYILLPQNVIKIQQLYGIDISKLTMSRSYRFRLLYNGGFNSYGLGSANTFLNNKYGFTLEMDLIRILFEMGFIGVFVFVNNFFNLVKGSWYRYLIMIFIISNLITSHSLADSFSWIIIYLGLGTISSKCNKKRKKIRM